MTTRKSSWFETDVALQRLMARQLGPSFEKARPRLARMGDAVANEGARWGHEADHHGPTLVTHDHTGARIDEIDYHHSYRELQRLGYGGGIVAATYNPELAAERGQAGKALTFGLGYQIGRAHV